MEPKIEPIRLRAHHIDLALNYAREYGSRDPAPEDFRPCYGKKYVEKYGELCRKILAGNTPITITDQHDDFCEDCGCKRDDGCEHSDFFLLEMSIIQADKNISKRYGLVLGRTYEGADFLKALGISSRY
jgi:hypothetical protein